MWKCGDSSVSTRGGAREIRAIYLEHGMNLNPSQSGAAMDLGMNAKYQSDAADEAEKLKKKRLLDQQNAGKNSMSPYSGAMMSMSGNQF
jgi:hypothetical protein